MTKKDLHKQIVIVSLCMVVSIVSILLNNKVAYPICFVSCLLLIGGSLFYYLKKSKEHNDKYYIKHLQMNLAEAILAVGIILLIGSPLFMKYLSLVFWSYLFLVLGAIFTAIGWIYIYYLFNYKFVKK